MIIIDYKDSRPIYEQIVDRFQKLILGGVLKKDEQVPSVRTLAMELSINPNTIQKAYGELERQGYIYTIKGRGNFVSGNEKLVEERKELILKKLKNVYEEAAELGISHEQLLTYFEELKK